MFDYFINFLSNAHHVCSNDKLTKDLHNNYVLCPMTLPFTLGHNWVSTGHSLNLYYNSNISDNTDLWRLNGRLMHGLSSRSIR